ncbi:IclR family transcriptional regulator (plasmid) [Aquicoccus sp. G2-2]|uniref:IclR family transcriptional regulator n=1 Tax=Aquicoccus sp. G2-2 TaxID=3092120 RepID=UPI00366E2978
MSNAELAGAAGITRPTAARLTYTLAKLGYLKAEKSKYRLGWRVVSLGHPLLASVRFLQLAKPSIERLAQDVGGTVSIGVIDNTNFMYLETARANENIWSSPDIGTVGPLLRATVGHALCSLLTEEELTAKIEDIRCKAPEEWEAHGDAFIRGIADCRTSGLSIIKGDWVPETNSVGAPLFRNSDGEAFAINCRVPIHRLKSGQFDEEVAPRLKSLASVIRTHTVFTHENGYP